MVKIGHEAPTGEKRPPMSKPARIYLRRECVRPDEIELCRSWTARRIEESNGWFPLSFEAISVEDEPGFPPLTYVSFRDDDADEVVWMLERYSGKLRLDHARHRYSRSVRNVASALKIIEATTRRPRTTN